MKDKLEEILTVLNKVIAYFPFVYSAEEMKQRMTSPLSNLDLSLFAASLELLSIEDEIISLYQYLDKKADQINDEKIVVTSFVKDLKKNLDAYSNKLAYFANHTLIVVGRGEADSENEVQTICEKIIKSSRLLIKNASSAVD